MPNRSILIINPTSDYPSYFTTEVYASWGMPGLTLMSDLAIATLAAMVPSDWKIVLADESISPVSFDDPAHFVAITGKYSQRDRMVVLASEFRRRGRVVIIGGPYASLNPDDMRPHADILVTGEVEEIAPQLFADLANGGWKDRYEGTRPDLATSPIPRWDLYPNDRAVMGAVQTSRGCPFECEFCDVIEYLGRKQRHKNPSQVLAELDVLYRHGYRNIFLADDNFTAYRRRTKDLLAALGKWNEGHADDRVDFVTQTSLDIARDNDLLDDCWSAGVRTFFVGVETINEDSLRETKKRQNLLQDIEGAIGNILSHRISVVAGMIVGFDHDGPDIFDTMFSFFQRSPLPTLFINPLTAGFGTPLYTRLTKENRLSGGFFGKSHSLGRTNIIPARMNQESLIEETERLCQRAYSPAAFEERFDNFLSAYGKPSHAKEYSSGPVEISAVSALLFDRIATLGPVEKDMMDRFREKLLLRPDVHEAALRFIHNYAQVRYMLATIPNAPAPMPA